MKNYKNHQQQHIYCTKTQKRGTLWHSWLRYCATSWNVTGSIPDGVIGELVT